MRKTARSIMILILYILPVVPSALAAAAGLTLLPDRERAETLVLENETVKYLISLKEGPALTAALLKSAGKDLMEGNPPLMFCAVRSSLDVGYQLQTVEEASRGPEEVSVSVTQESSYAENLLAVKQTFRLGAGPELDWSVEVSNNSAPGIGYRTPMSVSSRITLPVMQKMKPGPEEDLHFLIPTGGGFYCIDSPQDFEFYFTQESDPLMPIDLFNTGLDLGVYFQVLKSELRFAFQDRDDFRSRVFRMTHEPGARQEILHCRICPHPGDWHAAFQAFKKHVRSGFDFTYYQRPVQDKFRQRFVSHFTFLYGHDIYDPENNRFRIDEFLDEGEANFGGYDYILLWHDYPRLGLDNRDQFAMYDDLPGGLEGLRAMVEKAHARNVQVFIPYKPWDIIGGRKNAFAEEARIAGAIGADGIFLDTMNESDRAFRDQLDQVSRDIVFSAEGRPGLKSAQLVTGSWNQDGRASNRMPNVDLLRFVLPEHNVRNINRGARQREELILNALFNGVGFIVWEDIFGEINRFTWKERILIRRYSRIIHENRDAYLCENPVPLVADLRRDLFVNAFPTADKCVYPAYQLNRQQVDRQEHPRLIGPFMKVDHPDNWHYVDVWNHQAIPAVKQDGKTVLVFPEEPSDVMSCIVALPGNLKVENDGKLLHIRAARPLENAWIHVNTVDNLTLMEQERIKLEGSSGVVEIAALEPGFPYLVLVKLMQDGVLKDEVVLDLGWKRF